MFVFERALTQISMILIIGFSLYLWFKEKNKDNS